MAKVGFTALKPVGKRRVVVIADAGERREPVDQLGLFGPESVWLVNGMLVKLGIAGHDLSPSGNVLKSLKLNS
jgi:hypothetical protein